MNKRGSRCLVNLSSSNSGDFELTIKQNFEIF